MLCSNAKPASEFHLLPRRFSLLVLIAVWSTLAFAQTGKLDPRLEEGHVKQVAWALLDSKDREAEALYFLSKLQQGYQKHDEALRLAEAAVKASPNKAAYHLQVASVLSDEISQASFFKKMSLARRVHSELETAMKLEPRNTDCLFGLMKYYEQAPGIAGGGRDKARHLADEIGRMDPSMGYLAQAELARQQKQTDKLEELYLSAVRANPKNFVALISLAGFYASEAQKKYELAEKYALQAVGVDRTRIAPYLVSAGQVAAFRNHWGELATILSQAEKSNHVDLNPFYQAGRTLYQLNEEWSRAEMYLRKYLPQDPEQPTPPPSLAR